MMAISFIVFLLAFLVVGIASVFRRKNNTSQDYYLASRSIAPWLVGLSAVATNNSGYMFIGVIGYTYAAGLSSVWLMLGWILGDFLASLFVHSRLRAVAATHHQSSYIGTLHSWAGFGGTRFRKLSAIFSLLFLLAYASAQLVAGGKTLQVLLDWPQWWGAVMGSVLVLLYCLAGGIRASIWTDAAQSIVMIVAMSIMLVAAVIALGGVDSVFTKMSAIDGYLAWTPDDLWLPGLTGGVIFFIGWLVAGFSVIAQPHIMVRFMTLNSGNGMMQTRAWYYAWFIAFYFMATAVGMLARIYLPETLQATGQVFDAELALPTMAMQLLPPIMVGLVLAGIFAATMSTADSLLLSCSSFVTQDLWPRHFNTSLRIKIATVLVTAAALGWALLNRESVFALVVLSWSMLGACFVPLIVVLICGGKLRESTALVMLLACCAWVFMLHWYDYDQNVYAGLSATPLGLLIYAISRLFYRSPPDNSTPATPKP